MRGFSTKTKYTSKWWRGTIATVATAPSMTKEVKVLADTTRACFCGGSRENKYYNSTPAIAVSKVHAKIWYICHRSR